MKRTFTFVELMIVIGLIAVVIAVAIPNALTARKVANETAAIGNVRKIATVQQIYKEREGSQTYTDLTTLEAAGYVSETIGLGAKQGYLFESDAIVSPIYIFRINANPSVPGQSGDKYFFSNQSGVIRFSGDMIAGPSDSSIGTN